MLFFSEFNFVVTSGLINLAVLNAMGYLLFSNSKKNFRTVAHT